MSPAAPSPDDPTCRIASIRDEQEEDGNGPKQSLKIKKKKQKAKNSKLLAEAEQDNQYFINVVSDGRNAAFWMQTGRFGGSS